MRGFAAALAVLVRGDFAAGVAFAGVVFAVALGACAFAGALAAVDFGAADFAAVGRFAAGCSASLGVCAFAFVVAIR